MTPRQPRGRFANFPTGRSKGGNFTLFFALRLWKSDRNIICVEFVEFIRHKQSLLCTSVLELYEWSATCKIRITFRGYVILCPLKGYSTIYLCAMLETCPRNMFVSFQRLKYFIEIFMWILYELRKSFLPVGHYLCYTILCVLFDNT